MPRDRAPTNRFYSNLLLTLVISIVVTLFAVSLILYMNFAKVISYHINNSEKTSLSQASYSVQFMTESAQTLALLVYSDPIIAKLLYYTFREPVETNNALDSLNTYRYITPFIHSIYIYNDKSETFYVTSPVIEQTIQSKSTFIDKEAVWLLSNFRSFKEFSPIPRLIPERAANGETKLVSVYTYLFHDLPGNSEKLDSVVILNVSDTWMHNTIQALDAGAPSNTFIVDANGRMIISNQQTPMFTDVSDQSYVNRIRQSREASGYFVDDVDEVKSLVIYVKHESLDWTFIRTIPYDRITAKIDRMRELTLLIGIVILAVGLAVSYVLSRRLYKPIHTALTSLKELEAEKRDRFHNDKQQFLRNLLRDSDGRADSLPKLFDSLRIGLRTERPFVLLLLQIDRYAAFCSEYSFSDRKLFKFSLMNVASELCSRHGYIHEAVDMENDQVVLVLNIDNTDRAAEDLRLHELIRHIQSSVQTYVRLSLTTVISARFYWKDGLSEVYREAEHASLHRIVYGHKSMIDVETLGEDTSGDFVYPFQKGQAFSEELLSGKMEEAKQRYADIIGQAVATNNYPTIQLTLTHLAFTFSKCLETLKRNGTPITDAKNSPFIATVNQLETLEEIEHRLFQLYEQMVSTPEDRKKTRYDELTVNITALIHEQYMDPNLSLASLAEAVAMSPAYLGRLFKKLTAKSIPDYILEVRIDKAKELLATTNASINDIAEQVGFANSPYFFKVFKKTNGVTPNDYRQRAAGFD
ncbi:Helix-turn-helix domain-containing protein [Paenibacillus sp. UNCCL117]|uniref:helix-turn-helix domain-containing protein n=1 Tax=unclassified Paenibacillus TaxID=185978 RepID=UPI0008859701|nr:MULTISPECIES: helix-turn-helix domain-containing protein [unclassified Paenibacillus]SDD03948.1 Helix-turn-helix domain-containing protein [Paenibacillus sp. cl123]SFW32195.1 Helix-turn-helix domain-containing protein [Paenibacillus sp. UNCCL117]